MNREGVIVSSFDIERQGQVHVFQVRIPREIKNVIGIEMGLFWKSGLFIPLPFVHDWQLPLNINRNINVGELKLQSLDSANIFYTGDLLLNQNIGHADFSSQGFEPKVYTHLAKQHEGEIVLRGESTIIQGVYRDKAAEQVDGPYSYKVNVYVWMEVKEEEAILKNT